MNVDELKQTVCNESTDISALHDVLSQYHDQKEVEDLTLHFGPDKFMVWVFALTHKYQQQQATSDLTELMEQTHQLFANLSVPEYRVCQKQFAKLYKLMMKLAWDRSDQLGVWVVHILLAGIKQLEEPHRLSLLHADLAEWAEWTGNCGLVREVVESHYHKKHASLEISKTQVIKFFYHAAEILMRLENWDLAVEYLTIVCSSIGGKDIKRMRKLAFYKWQLANLMAYGKVCKYPRVMTNNSEDWIDVAKKEFNGYHSFKALSNKHDNDSSAMHPLAGFEIDEKEVSRGNSSSNNSTAKSPEQMHEEHGTTRLVAQCLQRQKELSVLAQRDVFLSTRMDYLDSSVGETVAAREQFVVKMMLEGKLAGKLTASAQGGSTILAFDNSKCTASEQVDKLESMLSEVTELAGLLDQRGRALISKPTFIKHVRDANKTRGHPTGGGHVGGSGPLNGMNMGVMRGRYRGLDKSPFGASSGAAAEFAKGLETGRMLRSGRKKHGASWRHPSSAEAEASMDIHSDEEMNDAPIVCQSDNEPVEMQDSDEEMDS